MKSILLILAAFLSTVALADDAPILRFKTVAPGIYRGARPELVGVEYLAALGVKTDLDLENSMDYVEAESDYARAFGIRFVSIPMSGFFAPKEAATDLAVRILSDPANYPIFVHCKHGQDRTGLVVGLFRVFTEHWTPESAYQEMLADGFHPYSLFLLDWYYKRESGMDRD